MTANVDFCKVGRGADIFAVWKMSEKYGMPELRIGCQRCNYPSEAVGKSRRSLYIARMPPIET